MFWFVEDMSVGLGLVDQSWVGLRVYEVVFIISPFGCFELLLGVWLEIDLTDGQLCFLSH